MPGKRKRGTGGGDNKMEDGERSPTPTSVSSVKKRKKELQYDPAEIIQELFDTIRNYKSEEGKLLCESFIRVPKKRTNPDYYEVVSQPMDMLKIQQKMKMDEFEEIEQLTADVELMVNNSRAYYKKGSQEYIDATDLLDLYYEIRDELLVETFGETKEVLDDEDDDGEVDDPINLEEFQSKIDSIIQQEETAMQREAVGQDDKSCDPEDFEQLFASIVNAQDGERGISEPFHLLPYKTLYPNYYDVIKEPIDLKMIARKIQDNVYKSFEEMDKDMVLMVSNAKTFNEPKSLIFKDACTIKKVFDAKRRELEHRKTNAKSSERIRTRGVVVQKLSAQFAALEYPEPIDPTDIMEYEEDSGAETVMSEEENPMWNLFNAVKNYTMPDGSKIIDPYMKLPSKRYYPDYYEEIKKPLSIINVQKKLKSGSYTGLDDMGTDLNLVFDNAKKYNADESIIYKNACLLQKVIVEKKKELERFGFKEAESMTKNSYDDDNLTKSRGRPKSLTPSDTEKKKSVPKKINPDELLRKRLWTLYKSVYDFADNSGRLLRQIFMYLPSKRDYPDYYKVITDPIDLGTIETKIKNDRYPSEYNLMSDFDLMFKNARHYNEEGSQVYSDAITLEKALKAKWRIINQSAGVPRPMKTKTRKNPGPASLTSRLQDLYETIRDYQDIRGRALSSPFMKVPLKSDYPDYYEVIKKPIDMSHIQQKMLLKRYESLEDMVADFVQMFDNACKYNEPDSLIYKDALTLQRVCLEKKVELSDDWTNEVPDVRAVVQEMLTNLFISTYNHQDDEGRCYSDSFAELPERDPDADPNAERPLSFDHIKRNLDRGRYRRMDRFQDDIFKVFERARRLSRTDSQLYEDAIEMQTYYIKTRDDLCRNGETLLTPSLAFTERHLQQILEAEKSVKIIQEQRDDEDKKKGGDTEEVPQDTTEGEGSENSLRYKDQIYTVGDFVYVEPREPESDPHIMCIEKIFTDNSGQQQAYGNWFYRPNETFHLATRKFLQKEVFKSDYFTSITPNQIISKCYVMNVREYFKYKPEGYADNDVYVCEFRYTAKLKIFKKIKIWSVPRNEDLKLVDREVPLMAIRVASVFADKPKDEYDDGDMSLIDKHRNDVALEGQVSEEGHIFYEQLQSPAGSVKMGDCVYVKSDQDKPMVYRIDKIWIDTSGVSTFFGPLFIRPSDIEHPPTRLFYKNELFMCGVEEARTMDSIIGRCSILHVKDYCSSRPTEIAEHDVYICESRYHETEKTVRRLSKGLKKHTLTPRVTDDETLFFKKHIVPPKEPSPLLVKASEEIGYDGEESRDTFTDAVPDILNSSVEEFSFSAPVETPAPVKTPKRVEEIKPAETTTTTKKKGRGKRFPSGYLLFSGHIRKKISEESKVNLSFGEISRLVGIKWRNLEKEEKEKYEEKARKVAEEQQAKQEAAERAFNESLSKQQQQQQPQQQQQWSEQQQSGTQPGPARPSTPGNQGMPNGMGGPFMSPGAQRGNPAMMTNGHGPPGQGQRQPYMPQYQSPGGGMRQPMGPNMVPYPGQQQMAPPPPPPRPPSPMFVTVPPRTQRLLHSEAYLKYIEGLNAESRTISDWDKTFSATPENTQVPETSLLPTQWLSQGAGYHGSVTDALWALRDMMLKDALNVQRTLPFEAL